MINYWLIITFVVKIKQMSYHWNSRTELLLGRDRVDYLAGCHVLVVGLGGVGAYAAEQICRAGIGKMTLVDGDTINESNLNRQLPALPLYYGKTKSRSCSGPVKGY